MQRATGPELSSSSSSSTSIESLRRSPQTWARLVLTTSIAHRSVMTAAPPTGPCPPDRLICDPAMLVEWLGSLSVLLVASGGHAEVPGPLCWRCTAGPELALGCFFELR
jgi:hypothetical protein